MPESRDGPPPGALRASRHHSHRAHKAAFYDRAVGIYYDYPTGTNATPVSGPPPGSDNTANYWNGTYALTGTGAFDDGFNYLTNVGAYASAESPYGTFDQAGNVWEWNEVANDVTQRGRRGGGWDDNNAYLAASLPVDDDPMTESYDVGFRVAAAPEPEPVLLAAVGALTLAGLRRGHRDRRASARAGAPRR